MEKTRLTVNDILNKEFNIDFKGYSASEVDSFLDIVIEDFQTYNRNIDELTSKIAKLEMDLTNARNRISELELTNKVASESKDEYNSLDLLKRVSRLEKAVFKDK